MSVLTAGLVRLGPRAPARLVVVAALRQGLERMTAHQDAALSGEPEGVHQMRVATRRLRSDLRTFHSFLETGRSEPLRDELKWLASVLGAVRDLDVLLDRLETDAGRDRPRLEPLLGVLESRRDAARSAFLEAIGSPRYRAMVAGTRELAATPPWTAAADQPCRDVLPPRIAKVWKTLADAGRALTPASEDTAYHRVRILAKRVRYAVEAVAPALGKCRAAVEELAAASRELQDVLGEHQDAVTAAAEVASLAHSLDPMSSQAQDAVARLIKREQRAAKRSRRAFPAAWKRIDQKSLRSWF